MGAGVAGLRAAIELALHGEVLVVTKESLGESNTHYAQGGIAVALEGDADESLHLDDTLKAGDGLVYRPAAEALVAEGPLRVAELMEWGAVFDRAENTGGGALLRTREGAHSVPRILHANGDATGAEISRSLVAFARAHKRIRFAEWTRVTGLVIADGRIIAVDLASAAPATADSKPDRINVHSVLIASGGAGQVYAETTNPAVATGDGIALAAQAGAELADMEFYQFHPTALSLPGVPRFLLSEALRGEGAYLRNDSGERFMDRYHPQLELAPRDVVARAIAAEGKAAAISGGPRLVHLDMRHVTGIDLHRRFPGISAFLARHGLDLARDLIPVRPAAHYLMGGIRTDLEGRSSLPGLYAAGEAACTGVHGANRLASNSLLEAVVFSSRIAEDLAERPESEFDIGPVESFLRSRVSIAQSESQPHLEAKLRDTMSTHCGVLREAAGLNRALSIVSALEQEARDPVLRQMCVAALLVIAAALMRRESRGGHFRTDYPEADPELARRSRMTLREARRLAAGL